MEPDGFEVLARGIGFTEGPLWTTSGELWVVSMNRGRVYGLDPMLRPGAPITEIETGGGPNGLAEAPGGILYVAQNGAATTPSRSARPTAPGLQTIADGVVRDLVVTGQVAPNDLVVGPDGRVWFTDPVNRPGSRVCVYDPASGVVAVAIEDVVFPNGLAFGLDPADLYIADTVAGEILRYRVGDGPPYHREVFTRIPGTGPDGIAFDATGNLYVAAFEADVVLVIDPAGRPVRRLSTGDGSRPTNVCFAGPDLDRLVVTLAKGGRVVVAEERFAGRLASPWLPTR